jgi:hypothetical protein
LYLLDDLHIIEIPLTLIKIQEEILRFIELSPVADTASIVSILSNPKILLAVLNRYQIIIQN